MAFRFTGRQAFFAVVIILVLTATVLLINKPSSETSGLNPLHSSQQIPVENTGGTPIPLNENDETLNTNGTRFVDTITKIATDRNRNYIQDSLDKASYAPIIAQLDRPESVDLVLSSLSKDDFTLLDISVNLPKLISGNATKIGISKLQNNPHVFKIYYSSTTKALLQDSVPLINANWTWLLSRQSINITGQNITVCIVDTGINYSHADFGGCPFTTNITNSSCSKVIAGASVNGSQLLNNSNPMDYWGHGTHVAGIVGANGQIKGVAPDVKLAIVRAQDDNQGNPTDIAEGIQWCIDHKNSFNPPIRIISLSIAVGISPYNGVCDGEDPAVNAANDAVKNHGLLFVAATGDDENNGSIYSPACGSNITSVTGSTKADGQFSEFNRNSFTDLTAPGVYINSTRRTPELCLVNCTCSGNFMQCDGTSMAAPHVAGVAALLLQMEPDLTPSQVEDVLKITGKKMSAPNDNPNLNFSRIDSYKAISALNDSLLRVNTLSVINVSNLSRIFEFTIQNANLTNITNISWQSDLGDGTVISSTYNITQLLWKETALVRLKHNYTRNDIYIVNVSTRAGNLFHSRNITVYVGNLIVYDLKQINISGMQRTFQFTVRNNLDVNLTSVNWTMDFGNSEKTSGNQLITIENKTDIFFRIKHSYGSIGTFNVNVSANNSNYVDSQNISITVT